MHTPEPNKRMIQNPLKNTYLKLSEMIAKPLWSNIQTILEKRHGGKKTGNGKTDRWKKDLLEDFQAWLNDLPEETLKEGDRLMGMESCDLYTVLSEFAALRQEIKLQNREQHRAVKSLTSFIEDYKDTADLFRNRTMQLSELEEKIHLSCEKNIAKSFFDIRDALTRGQEAARQMAEKKGLFSKTEKEHRKGIYEGYELAIRRFDRAMAGIGIEPVETVGRHFDPQIMRAVGKTSVRGKAPGIVIEEHRCGFTKSGIILRVAEVVVNK